MFVFTKDFWTKEITNKWAIRGFMAVFIGLSGGGVVYGAVHLSDGLNSYLDESNKQYHAIESNRENALNLRFGNNWIIDNWYWSGSQTQKLVSTNDGKFEVVFNEDCTEILKVVRYQ